MTLRPAMPEDASSIAAISLEVWIGTYLKKGVSPFFADYALSAFTADRAGMLIADPAEFIVVSQNDEGIDGFIRVTEGSTAPVKDCSGFEIATFYVQPRHHGKGIGSALLNAALAHCRSRSASSVWLTTNAENAPAIAFYLDRGFVEVGKSYFTIADQNYLNNVYSHPLS